MKRFLFFLLFIFLLIPTPLFASVSIIGSLTREFIVLPGDKLEGGIILKNNKDKPVEVSIYQVDYLFYADGRNIYGKPGSNPRSNANWITISPKRLMVPPKATSTVSFKIQVPKESNLKGTYWSMIMVEPIGEVRIENIEDESGKIKIGIHTVIRYGIQIITNISDTGEKKVKILNRRLIRSSNNTYIFQLDLENIGERGLQPKVILELYSKKGGFVGKFEADKRIIYPGTSVRYELNLKGIEKGEYKALMIIDNGDKIWGAQYNLKID
ncbi:MAG: hypothetical protein ACPLKX_09025 [Dictyoglomaceae bacterium]